MHPRAIRPRWARWLVALLAVLAMAMGPATDGLATTQVAAAASSAGARRINVHPTSGPVVWSDAPIFWFGQATSSDAYVDVRVAYDAQALYVFSTVVDYYLWDDTTGTSDPRSYDAFGLYLGTGATRSTAPQSTDLFFVSGYGPRGTADDTRWQRQGRGNNGAWDETWKPSPAWTDRIGDRFDQSGPNNNSDLDSGWATTLTIPWATLGLTGPPSSGATWAMGAVLFNRDAGPPAAPLVPEVWPETFSTTAPTSWGTIAFDPPAFAPAPATVGGTTTIRRGLNGTVQDAYVGGGGNCGGGKFGGGEVPHPTDNLFVQNESDMSDFPCFSKSYLEFDLSALPANKTIISAVLRIYQFGNSDPSSAQPSYIQLSSVSDAWDENTLTWNNAPLAQENLSGTTVNALPTFPGFPGVPNTWDATELVSDAYAAGHSANLVLYSADTSYNSGKYFVSSDSGDWNADGRPTLIVTWGDATPSITQTVAPVGNLRSGATATYTLAVTGAGRALTVVEPLPPELTLVPGSVTGGASFDPTTRSIVWTGTPAPGQSATIDYQAQVTTVGAAIVTSTATLTDGAGTNLTASAMMVVNGYSVELPAVVK